MKGSIGARIDFVLQCLLCIPTTTALIIGVLSLSSGPGGEVLIFGAIGHFFVGVLHLLSSFFWGVIRNIPKTRTYFMIASGYVLMLIMGGTVGIVANGFGLALFVFIIPQGMALYYFSQSYQRLSETEMASNDKIVYADLLDN